jgi:hypothetical protein
MSLFWNCRVTFHPNDEQYTRLQRAAHQPVHPSYRRSRCVQMWISREAFDRSQAELKRRHNQGENLSIGGLVCELLQNVRPKR